MTPVTGTLHVLYSLRAEGCPRLALGLLTEELKQTGRRGAVAVCRETPADLLPEFNQLGIPLFPLHWRPKGFLGLARRSRRLLGQTRPRGVVCYTVGLHVPIAWAARSVDCPMVVHLGCAPPRNEPWKLRKFQLLIASADRWISHYAACSEHVRQESLEAYNLNPEKVTTVPNGIALENFFALRDRTRMPCADGTITVGMVGSLEASRDQTTLLRAIKMLIERGQRVHLRLIGGGTRDSNLRALAGELGIEKHVEWTGSVNDIGRELARLDVFAFSVHTAEGLGIALVEALAAGLPAVASDVGACREVLAGGRWGRLVETGNVAAWAEAILAARAQSAAPIAALTRYDIRSTAPAYGKLIERAMG